MEADVRLDRRPAEMPIENCLGCLKPHPFVRTIQQLR
jgi:hypothetical protein